MVLQFWTLRPVALQVTRDVVIVRKEFNVIVTDVVIVSSDVKLNLFFFFFCFLTSKRPCTLSDKFFSQNQWLVAGHFTWVNTKLIELLYGLR